jgi:hypothetical protein
MNIMNSSALAISGGLVACSIILAKIGLSRSVLSRKVASAIGGIGAGTGVGIFIYYGISNSDLVGSIITGAISAITIGLVILIPSRWWR